jgi:hypothetical protein
MEKNDKEGRIIWIKALPTHPPRPLVCVTAGGGTRVTAEGEKTEILQSLFRTYVKQVKRLAEEIGINKKMLEETFRGRNEK